MPDTSGEGFFTGGPQIGHEHLQISTGLIYEYIGGPSALAASWKVKDGTNVYLHIGSNVTQVPSTTNPTQVTYEIVSWKSNITYDNVGTVTIAIPGVYLLSTNGQVMKTGGAGIQQMTQWFRKNGVDIDGSPVSNSVSANANDMRVVRNYRVEVLNAGDTISVWVAVATSGVGLGLYPLVGVGPASPSAKLTLFRLPI